MAKKVKCKTGDIFSIPVSETEFIFGKILFDVENQYLKNKVESQNHFNKNYLGFFEKCFLVQTYKGVYQSIDKLDFNQIAVNSTFVFRNFLSKHGGKIETNESVNPHFVTFPETLSSVDMKYYLSVGELYLPLPINNEEYERINIFPVTGYGYYEIVMATLDYSGREDLMEEDKMDNYFKYSDLRSMLEIRNKIYALIHEDPNQSYYEMALKHGFDLSRLYK